MVALHDADGGPGNRRPRRRDRPKASRLVDIRAPFRAGLAVVLELHRKLLRGAQRLVRGHLGRRRFRGGAARSGDGALCLGAGSPRWRRLSLHAEDDLPCGGAGLRDVARRLRCRPPARGLHLRASFRGRLRAATAGLRRRIRRSALPRGVAGDLRLAARLRGVAHPYSAGLGRFVLQTLERNPVVYLVSAVGLAITFSAWRETHARVRAAAVATGLDRRAGVRASATLALRVRDGAAVPGNLGAGGAAADSRVAPPLGFGQRCSCFSLHRSPATSREAATPRAASSSWCGRRSCSSRPATATSTA